MLRPYQQRAHDAAVSWMRRSVEPCLIEACTAAGKSHVIAAIAQSIGALSGKKTLVLQPSAELVTQNRAKYLATGNPASVFSASAGGRSTQHAVVFGTPLTVKNALSRFGNDYGLLIIDECHGLSPTVLHIIDRMRQANPKLRVLGLTATPFRLLTGYCYRADENGKVWGDTKAKDPFFTVKVATITARELLALGFVSPVVIGELGASGYDTSKLQLNRMGQFDAAAVDAAFVGHGRKTAAIVADVLHASKGRKGIMFFASTVRHAEEVMASLPPQNSALLTGDTPKKERESIISRFKAQSFRHLVSVGTVTTGFDAVHVDIIAMLRATESAALFTQIVGRGMRIADGKADCLLMDYAENIERHFPDGDIFNPDIRARTSEKSGAALDVHCPLCDTLNEFTARPNDADWPAITTDGYFASADGSKIMGQHGPEPAHFGRRCFGLIQSPARDGTLLRCSYRWTSKECEACGHDNDIAARYCEKCKAEIIDPGAKLVADFKAMKKDPTQVQIDEVIKWSCAPSISSKGNETLKVTYTTPYRSFTVWMTPKMHAPWTQFQNVTRGGEVMPETVTYKKDGDWYRVLGYNQPADEPPNA